VTRETFTTDNPEADRIARLIAELDELPFEERDAAIAALPEEDREAVWAVELEQKRDTVVPGDHEFGDDC